ncbi:hypothetical protein Tco_0645082, partial [Tanacetum coccineum]
LPTEIYALVSQHRVAKELWEKIKLLIQGTSNLVSNKPMLSSTGVKQSTSASGSQPSGNTKKDKIQ